MAATFSWDYPGLNKNEFVALTYLLSLRSDGQVEPSSTAADLDLDEQTSENDEIASIDTESRQQISDSGQDILKKQFLNAIAEFASKEAGGKFVTCTAMREHEEEVEVYITRNTYFDNSDFEFFSGFGALLNEFSRLSASPRDTTANRSLVEQCTGWFYAFLMPKRAALLDTAGENIWLGMLEYHGTRIQKTYIPRLRHSFMVCTDIPIDSADTAVLSASHKIRVFRDYLLNMTNSEPTVVECGILATEAYRIRNSRYVKHILVDSPSATAETQKLWENIYFLSRLRGAVETIKTSLAKIPGFFKVNFTLVKIPRGSKDALQSQLGLEKTLGILGVRLELPIIKRMLGSNWTIKGAKKKFAALQNQRLHMHAEVQMVLHMGDVGETLKGVYKYFGCSKKCCFMCWSFLRALGTFTTRGCHGQLYNRWTVAKVSNLRLGYDITISKALIQVQENLTQKLRQEVHHNLRKERTSVVGGSSMVSNSTLAASQQFNLEKRKQEIIKERVAFEFSRLTTDAKSPPSSSHYDFANWKRPVTPADILYVDCLEDKLPKDPEVLDKFGFSSLLSFHDKSNLLGLYQGLRLLEVPFTDLDIWQREGSLVENIKREYNELPENIRGGYFPWFLENTHIFDPSFKCDTLKPETYRKFMDEARSHLTVEERKKDWKKLEPRAKRESFELLFVVLMGAHPNPIQEIWSAFGFCACRTEHEENEYGGIFVALLSPRGRGGANCTFDEFWRAHESGRLVTLIHAKGLSIDPRVERFLSSPSEKNISVWDLKRFIRINDPADRFRFRSIVPDYGFINCEDLEDTCILMEIYRRLLEIVEPVVDPLELHQACIEGKLFKFAKSRLPHEMKDEYERLMLNPYP